MTSLTKILVLCALLVAAALNVPGDCDSASDAGLKLLASYDLVKPGTVTQTLPAAYCNRTDLVYDLTMSATANWDSSTNSNPQTLFTLGRNMNGQVPNSVCVMVWSGETLFARLTPSDLSDTAEATTPKLKITPGEQFVVHARWTSDTISLDFNGKHIGDGAMSSQFKWPANRPYFIGYEDTNYNPWTGTISSGELKVYETRINAEVAGGRAAGYFSGAGAHKLAIIYPRGDGSKTRAHLTLTDIHGTTIINHLAPVQASARAAVFALPPLKYGWYSADIALDDGEAHTSLMRSIAVTPEIASLDSTDKSPFGIADGGMLQEPGKYNPGIVGDQLDRVEAMGIRWLRVWVSWTLIEPQRGVYNWTQLDNLVANAKRHGLTIYPALVGGTAPWQSYQSVEKASWYLMSPDCYMPRNLADWSDYMTAFAKHYRGSITYYQVWNEPDARNGFFPFEPSDYAKVVKATADAVHGVDPHNVVGIGGFCAAYAPSLIDRTSHTGKDNAWGLAEFYAQKPTANYDVMDCHFYTIDKPGQSWDGDVAVVQALHKAMDASGDGHKPLWDSEVTFATGVPGAIGSGFAQVPLLSGEDQAGHLIQLYAQSASVGIERTFWYSLRGYAGLINSDFSPLPSYAAHVELSQRLAGMRYQQTLNLGPDTRAYEFQSGKRRLVVGWTTKGANAVAAKMLLPNCGALQCIDMMGNKMPLKPASTVSLTTVPQYVVGMSK